MDYIGSKEKLNDWIFSIIKLRYSSANGLYLLDACSGSGAVSRHAARVGFNVISNDILTFPYHITRGSISFPQCKLPEAHEHVAEIRRLSGEGGFFYKNYSVSSGRSYFTDDNAQRIDAVRRYIHSLEDGDIKSYLFFCALEGLSKVSNTTGVQSAFLKEIKTRALREFVIETQESLHVSSHVAFVSDIAELLVAPSFKATYKEDILYIDPPYNTRQYGSNYHLYETFVRGDEPVVKGITGVRNWKEESKSTFCSKSGCLAFLERILNLTTAERVFISYNSDGLISPAEMIALLGDWSGRGGVHLHEIGQRRYKSDSASVRRYNETGLKEYLFEGWR